jgi:hypothetical protein
MKDDEIIQELCQTKDQLAKESGYDIRLFIEKLQTMQDKSSHHYVNPEEDKQTDLVSEDPEPYQTPPS